MAASRRIRPALSDVVFLGISSVLFAASAALTVVWCTAMSAMGGMPMAGGWTMSMAWMPMPGQSWSAAAASFTGMWVVMMVAMMLPAVAPALWRYRQTAGGVMTVVAGAGYFLVWSALGVAVFPIGALLASAAMRDPSLSRLAPVGAGVIVIAAGVLQLTWWKARHLAGLRDQRWCACGPPEVRSALRDGLRLGVDCARCCGGLMAILLAAGVMDLRAMAVLAAAIGAERLAPAGERVARAIGVVAIAVGTLLLTASG